MANPYLVWDVSAKAGQTLEVKLEGVESFVWLMTSDQFLLFEAGFNAQVWGGLARRSPYSIPVPQTGKFKLVVKPAGSGTVHAWARIV